MEKKITAGIVISVLAILFLFGCTSGTSTNLNTGQTTKNISLSYDNTYLSVNDKKVSSNEATLGDVIKVNFVGLSGFTPDANGLIHPGISMKVTGVDGNVIYSEPNFSGNWTKNGVDPKPVNELVSVSLNTGKPMVSGATYHIKVTMWDAKNATAYLESNVDLKMK